MTVLYIAQRITPPSQPGILRLPNNRTLVESEVRGLASLYWPGSEIDNAVAVSKCESGWETGAWAYIGEDSRGLWQLNVQAHPELIWYDLGDPQINAYFAYHLWFRQGWKPWTCAHQLGII